MLEKWNVARFIYKRKVKIGFFVNAKSFKLNACILSNVWYFSNLFSWVFVHRLQKPAFVSIQWIPSTNTWVCIWRHWFLFYNLQYNSNVARPIIYARTLAHWSAMHGHSPITLLAIPKKRNKLVPFYSWNKEAKIAFTLCVWRSLCSQQHLYFSFEIHLIWLHTLWDPFIAYNRIMSRESAHSSQCSKYGKISKARANYDVYKLNGTWKFTKVL